MNSYGRNLSLKDGMKKVDLSKYKCFKIIGNSMNTAETITYILDNINPKQDFKIKIYFRNYHIIVPRLNLGYTLPGLPVLYVFEKSAKIRNAYFGLLKNKNVIDYFQKSRKAHVEAVCFQTKMLGADFFFHPVIQDKIEFIKFSGDDKEVPVEDGDLLIDTRNDLYPVKKETHLSNHLEIDQGHTLHPLALAYVTTKVPYRAQGINDAVWAVMTGQKPKDKYYRMAEKHIQNGELGGTFWFYAHDIQQKLVPFAYFFFPISTQQKLRLWKLVFHFLRYTGLIAFFINIKEIEKDDALVNETEGTYFRVRKQWERLDERFGSTTPYPISYFELDSVLSGIKCSLVDIKRNIKFYKKVRTA